MNSKKIYGPWIKWHGGECPVPPDTLVEVKLRSGALAAKRRAGSDWWHHNGGSADIIAYRTVTEALRAQFEKLLSDSGRACLYEGDGQYAYPHDFAWLCFQAGYAAGVADERERCAQLCDKLSRRAGDAMDCRDAIRAGAKETGNG